MQVLTGASAADVSTVQTEHVGCHKGRWRNKLGLEVAVSDTVSAVRVPALMKSVSFRLYAICLFALSHWQSHLLDGDLKPGRTGSIVPPTYASDLTI